MIAIIDCYTDEPAGLGVPPYLGVYPRYLYGLLKKKYGRSEKEEIIYLTIDDVRLIEKYDGKILVPKESQRTNIASYNLSKNYLKCREILANAKEIYCIIGVHTPGKYLSAVPGTIDEIKRMLSKDILQKVTVCGPITIGGSQIFGGKKGEKAYGFPELEINKIDYDDIAKFSVTGASVIEQIEDLRIIEIETGRGCDRKKGCSFCLEPLKNRVQYRQRRDIVSEIDEFYKRGARHFRLGKQSCFYAVPENVELLREIREKFKEIKTLHIDNVNPVNVIKDEKNGAVITKAIVKYCTSGNVAAFGVESFDPEVVSENNLNCTPEIAFSAIKILNEYGREIGENGMPKFLPGINIIFGLKGETKKTHEENMKWLTKAVDEGLMLRRINIRTVIPYEGTDLQKEVGLKAVKKNKKHYYRWREDIRQKIDLPNLKKIAPISSVLKDVWMEIYDGKNTFGRQIGTYPLIVGVKERVKLKESYDIEVKGHMLRSIVGKIIRK